MQLSFHKYHGTGNDFVLFDNRQGMLIGDEHAFFKALCHRRFGIGADGVILLNPHPDLDFEMDYFNSDGNRSSMCGNGGRCIVRFAADLGLVSGHAVFEAVDGRHEADLTAFGVKLKMGLPEGFRQLDNGDYWIDTGSPHYVHFLPSEADLGSYDVFGRGRSIRNSPPWAEAGTNVNFVTELPDGQLHVRTYERGVEDETWSCGTGVTAVAEVYSRIRNQGTQLVRLLTPGGQLRVHVRAGAAPSLEGPAQFVFQGRIEGP